MKKVDINQLHLGVSPLTKTIYLFRRIKDGFMDDPRIEFVDSSP